MDEYLLGNLVRRRVFSLFFIKLNVAKALREFRKLVHDVQLVLIVAMVIAIAIIGTVIVLSATN
ncbi:hypothetical protein ACFP3T_09995 [Lactiplantibacillus dongliensis]|uniref:DUF4044 domain-containing protein n=1 Tax=Lactiplantibacillus dongliensis TaxID=2559919 RepID=A0ABW1R5W3_9LACO|nr:hypothetical protein [Lactiplantibacillus dongliensis]